MAYETLRGLYLGTTSNADLSDFDARLTLHVRTALDDLIPVWMDEGSDVVLTGNPGDGKSHAVRNLIDRGGLRGAHVELDVSATPTVELVGRWRAARAAGRRSVLCANEGPLTSLLEELAPDPVLGPISRELRGQLGRLVVDDPRRLPPQPREAILVDLADRNLLDPSLVRGAIDRLRRPEFFPMGLHGRETLAGRNLSLLLESSDAAGRLARLLCAAGVRGQAHVTFRELWAAISYGICGGKAASTLFQELRLGGGLVGSNPLDLLCSGRGQGALIGNVAGFADPASLASPDLDEDLWSHGEPQQGEWLVDLDLEARSPAGTWDAGETAAAIERFRSLKRLVALAHSRGAELVERTCGSVTARLGGQAQDALLPIALRGLRRSFLSAAEEPSAPGWLLDGLPLWVSHTYQDAPVAERPHAAVSAVAAHEFAVRGATRAPWLGAALGPPPEVSWLTHEPSGIALRLDPAGLDALVALSDSSGPADVPEPVARFLSRLSGWEERKPGRPADRMAVLGRPRGALIGAARILRDDAGVASYGGPDVD